MTSRVCLIIPPSVFFMAPSLLRRERGDRSDGLAVAEPGALVPPLLGPAPMQRTLVLINNTGLGGAERRFGRLFARMADEDPDTTLAVNASLWRKLVEAGVVSGREDRIWQLPEPFGRVTSWAGMRQDGLGFWLRKLDYGLFGVLLLVRCALAPRRMLHLLLGGAYVGLPLMLLRPDHRTVISVVHNLPLLVGSTWALPVYRFAVSRCHGIDALSEGVRADLLQRGLSGERIFVSSGSVVDAVRFQPALEKAPWVVFSGRLVGEKNPLLFIEAVPAVLQAVPEAKFFMLGEGPLAPRVEQALDRLKLRDAVTVGFRPDPAPVLGKARVFVSLQRTDNYPSQALLEAMACGMAVVATDVGQTWKLVDETVGLRVKADAASVAAAVVRLLREPARASEMGQRGRERVMRHHSTEAYLEYLEGVYKNLGWERSAPTQKRCS